MDDATKAELKAAEALRDKGHPKFKIILDNVSLAQMYALNSAKNKYTYDITQNGLHGLIAAKRIFEAI